MDRTDLLCFSHLRWNFVYQRPNHLMSRCARERRVFFIEEPLVDDSEPHFEIVQLEDQLFRVVPHMAAAQDEDLTRMLVAFMREWHIEQPVHWYYSPMFLKATRELPACATVYDCMDELSAFRGAPAELGLLERELLSRADVVFTGGMALYEHKRALHPNVHGVPSSVDVPFFAQARDVRTDPPDQAPIARPRVGYYGVIDERIDLTLLAELAARAPDVQFVMVGPLAKISDESLPRAANIHYLGPKTYQELPAYAAGWDVALMPFALNEATRFISPTKTPEYLAAGRPVLSSAVRDVVEPYERLGLVRIGRTLPEFEAHLRALLEPPSEAEVARRDAFLATVSWDRTWERMREQLDLALARKRTGSCAPSRAAE